MTRTALFLASLLTLNGSLAAASMPRADCTAREVCAVDLRLLVPPPPDPAAPALPLTPASLRDAEPVAQPRGAQ